MDNNAIRDGLGIPYRKKPVAEIFDLPTLITSMLETLPDGFERNIVSAGKVLVTFLQHRFTPNDAPNRERVPVRLQFEALSLALKAFPGYVARR